tara:strand:+ start:1476 stop:5045 length:3570 start_codon:yes stop_codon:yes gene_type:complete
MPFLSNDHYLTSGTSQLINSWTDPVYKFDSSSFYNWEQDNLPIYDLEERDDFLYEMAGYPASSVTGMSLCVSDCGIDNKKVFGTISDAIDALPNTIRFPIIIEVAASGELGELRLQDKVFEGSTAGLEIINRGFVKGLCGSGVPVGNVESVNSVGLVVSSIMSVSSDDINNTMLNSSAICVSSTVYATTTAADYWDNYVRAFFITPEWSKDTAASPRTASISTFFSDLQASPKFWAGSNQYNMGSAWDTNGYEDNSVSSDMYIVDGTADPVAQIYRDAIAADDLTRATGFIYANSLSNVSIKGCVGPVYVRGFCVDGGNQASFDSSPGAQITAKGFDIQNSDVVIENCTATRCTHAGLCAVNSNVILNRGFIAFRNYELISSPNNLDTKVLTNETPGLKAINSNVVLSSTTASDTGLPIDSPYCFYRNIVGIELENSKLGTPPNFQFGKNAAGADFEVGANYGSQTLVLQSFLNKKEGIKATNSIIDTSQRIASFANEVGVKLNSSVLNVGQFTFDHNQLTAVHATDSTFNYNKDGIATGIGSGPFYPVYNFDVNGQDIVLAESEMVPTYVSGMDAVYETFSIMGNHQCKERPLGAGVVKTTLPSVVLKHGSYMDGIGVKSINSTFITNSTKYEAAEGVRGAAFSVTDNSTLRLVGHKNNATWVLGPYNSDKQQRLAGLYAGDSSKIYLAGPTVVAQYGIDALAEDNSVVEIGPPLTDGVLDVSGFNLADQLNHTKVQLHSTRACLVANRNSTLDMHDLGDYHAHWDSKYYYDGANEFTDYPTGDGTAQGGSPTSQSMYATSAFTSSGLMQFYPNPFVPYGTAAGTQLNLASQAAYPSTSLAAVPTTLNTYTKITNFNNDVSNASWGGMCIRAVGGSNVNVKNVMFPTGWAEPSGAYYDASTVGQCDLLRIWNIADESQLHASYLSVSSFHPQDVSATYTGPSAVWVSGASPTYIPLSGAPSSTPHTNKLSVLDSFGLGYNHGGEMGMYGPSSFENIGPFRIYVSPHPKAKFLGYVKESATGNFYTPYGAGGTGAFFSMGYGMPNTSVLVKGAPYQILSQGYSTSSDCSATNNQGPNYLNPSSIYQDLGFSAYISTQPQLNMSTENQASSFFYTSAMLGDSQNRIWLDESAMNTFANAKNGTLGTSGRKKIFSYYKTIKDSPGESFWQANSGYGVGFKSANLFDLDRDV